jgi:RNA polymerase sigma-70 factor (ECF subfamily)
LQSTDEALKIRRFERIDDIAARGGAMNPEPDFQHFITRLRAGDERACDEIFQRYVGKLITVARRRLDARLQRKVDPEDIVQSVFKSFFAHGADGSLVPNDPEHLWALLVTITDRKCSKWLRHFEAARRTLRRETAGQIDYDALARDPTPSDAAILNELVEQLLNSFDEREREIVARHLQNETVKQIREGLGCSERTIFRVQERARKRLRRLIEQAEE